MVRLAGNDHFVFLGIYFDCHASARSCFGISCAYNPQTKYRFCRENNPIHDCEEPFIDAGQDFLYRFWQIMYWISFNIQMFVAPLMQGYCTSGSFTPGKRFKDGVMENVWFYAAIVVPAIPFVLYAIFGLGIPVSKLLDLAIPGMNSYGLILLVLLMSYGLVEIPRSLWFESSVEWKLRYLEATAPSLKESCVDSEAEVYEMARLAALASVKIPETDALRPYVNTILEKVSTDFNFSVLWH